MVNYIYQEYLCHSCLNVFIQAPRTTFTMLKKHILNQILTNEANVCLPSNLAMFRGNGRMEIAKMDFFLFKNKMMLTSCADLIF